jgi:hypothetical protein
MTVVTRRRATALRLAALAVVVVVLGAACSVPSDNEARAIDPTRLVAASSNKINCTTPGVDAPSIIVRVYLVSTEDEPPAVTPVERVLSQSVPSARAALDALFRCRVTAAETDAGLATVVPEETQILGLDPIPGVEPGYYLVKLGPLQNRGSKKVADLDKVAVAQIFFTLTAPDLIDKVKGLRFAIDGRAVAVNTDKRTVSQTDFVTRDDFLSSSPPNSSGNRTTVTSATAVVPSTERTTTTRGS